ncbi:MAG: dihydrodipicolinate synthase family protein [bacterium]
MISGDDALTLPLIACGAIGVISVIANAYPTHFSQMVKLCLDGKFEAARHIHEKLIPAIQSIFSEGSPSGVKTYLTEMGIVKYNFRLPVVGVSDVLKQEIRGIMKTL